MDYRMVILRKLYNRRIIGGKHTAIEHLTGGIPGHLVGEAKHVIAKLIQGGYLLPKPTGYGLQVSINPEKLSEVEDIIRE